MDIKLIIIICILLVTQGTLIYRDAVKSKIKYPWIWGCIGLLNVPSSGIIYLIYKKFIRRK